MRIRREEAGRALEILEDYHSRLFAPEDSETRSSIEQIIRIFKSELFQALLDIHDVYEVSVKNSTNQENDHSHSQESSVDALPLLSETVTNSSKSDWQFDCSKDNEAISATDVQKLFSPGKLNELLGAVLQHDKKRKLEEQEQNSNNHLQVKHQHHLSASSSPLPLESIGEAASESESSSSNFETVHDYYPNGQLNHLNGSPEIISRINDSFSPVLVNEPKSNLDFNFKNKSNTYTDRREKVVINNKSESSHDNKSNSSVDCINNITTSNLNGGSAANFNNSSSDITNHSQQSAVHSHPALSLQSNSFTNMSINPGWEYEEVIIDRGSSGLGFSIAGGIDNPHIPDDTSIYITKVIHGGAAFNDGRLQIDDIILKVNDTSLVEVSHSVAVEALKLAGTRVHLFVKRRKPSLPPSVSAPANMGGEVLQVELFKTASKGLGFSIAGGIGNQHIQGDNAIYITKVMEKGAASIDGRIEVGDKLVAVNDIQLDNVTHEDAVAALKASSDQVLLLIRKPPSRSGKSSSNSSSGVSPITVPHIRQQLNSLNASNARQSATLTRTSLQSLPVTTDSVTYDERSQTLPMPRHANNSQQQSNNVYNHSQNRLTKSSEGVDMTDNLNVVRDVRKVVLNKSASGLGFNIVGGEDGEGIFISFILAGGAADQCEQIFRGDQVLEVNGVDLRNSTHQEAAQTLKKAGNIVSLLLVYKPEEFRNFEAKIQDLREQQNQMHFQSISGPSSGTIRMSTKRTLHVRTLFDYDPSRDSGLPSRGLYFRFGEILHITNASDDEWWQARHVLPDGTDDSQVGIVPSRRRVERREKSRLKSVKFYGANDYSDGKLDFSSGLDRKKKNFSFSRKFPFMKSRESSNEDLFTVNSCENLDAPNVQSERSSISGSGLGLDDITELETHFHSYEIVHTIQISYARPLVILGPLKERINDDLISDYPERFGSCIPHTTRSRREGEVNGRDYHFVPSREKMEFDIEQGFFVEAGQYRENLYGTSVVAVKELAIKKHKHCILDVSAAAIRRLRAADLHPISILIRARSLEQIHEWDKHIDPEEAKEQYERAIKLEDKSAYLFTAIISGDTPEEIYNKVKLTIADNAGPTIWVSHKNQRLFV